MTTVFDDTTQESTDKISRAIIYDLTELESASRLKKGDTERTPKKIANVNKWFVKLDKDFTSLLAYYKSASGLGGVRVQPWERDDEAVRCRDRRRHLPDQEGARNAHA